VERSEDDRRATAPEPEPKGRPVYLTLAETANEPVDLLTLWKALLNGRWLIIGMAGACAVVAITYSLLVKPVYRAEVVLAPAGDAQSSSSLSRLGGLASLVGVNLGVTGNSAESVAMLQSRKFVEDFIREEQLLPVLFPDDWDAKALRWNASDPEDQPDIRDAVDLFTKDIRLVSEDSQTGLVTFAIEWTDPRLAAEWANKLVARINATIRTKDVAESQRKLDYLNAQIKDATLMELREAIARVIEDQINAMMLAQAQIEYAFKVIDPATVPKRRIFPKRTLIVAVATFLGGAFAVFLLLVRFTARSRRGQLRP